MVTVLDLESHWVKENDDFLIEAILYPVPENALFCWFINTKVLN